MYKPWDLGIEATSKSVLGLFHHLSVNRQEIEIETDKGKESDTTPKRKEDTW